jgi:hypothetical protein
VDCLIEFANPADANRLDFFPEVQRYVLRAGETLEIQAAINANTHQLGVYLTMLRLGISLCFILKYLIYCF